VGARNRQRFQESATVPGTVDSLNSIPRWERWDIRYPDDPKRFARILDFFDVEIGVAGGGIKDVTYLSRLSERVARLAVQARRVAQRLETLLSLGANNFRDEYSPARIARL